MNRFKHAAVLKMYAEDGTRGHTQASGGVSAATVSDFVESFWYWKKQH